MSRGSVNSWRCARNSSRKRRFTLFRTVARFSIFVVTAIARRLSFVSDGITSRRKCLEYSLLPCCWHRSISDRLRSLASGPYFSVELPIVPLARRSYRDLLTTTSTACVKHLTATLGRHSLSKAVSRLTTLFAWLIRAFHSVTTYYVRRE